MGEGMGGCEGEVGQGGGGIRFLGTPAFTEHFTHRFPIIRITPPFLRINILIRGGGSTTLPFMTYGIKKHQSVRDLQLSMRTKWLKNECRVRKINPIHHYFSKYPPPSLVLHCGNKSQTSGIVPQDLCDAIIPTTIRRM